MRLDKFLKVSRIIKRRTLSKEISESSRVKVNGKVAKPSTRLKVGDEIEIEFGRIGADTHITPREVIRDFIELLNIVMQNPSLKIETLLTSEDFAFAQTALEENDTDAMAEFEI